MFLPIEPAAVKCYMVSVWFEIHPVMWLLRGNLVQETLTQKLLEILSLMDQIQNAIKKDLHMKSWTEIWSHGRRSKKACTQNPLTWSSESFAFSPFP